MTHRNIISKAVPMFSGSGNSMPPSTILSDVTGSRKFKTAAVKQELLIFQLLDLMETPYQRLSPILGVQEVDSAIANAVRCNRKSAFSISRPPNRSTYVSACRQDSNAVPTAISHFRGSGIQWRYCDYGSM
jgi:hypothetical protein